MDNIYVWNAKHPTIIKIYWTICKRKIHIIFFLLVRQPNGPVMTVGKITQISLNYIWFQSSQKGFFQLRQKWNTNYGERKKKQNMIGKMPIPLAYVRHKNYERIRSKREMIVCGEMQQCNLGIYFFLLIPHPIYVKGPHFHPVWMIG